MGSVRNSAGNTTLPLTACLKYIALMKIVATEPAEVTGQLRRKQVQESGRGDRLLLIRTNGTVLEVLGEEGRDHFGMVNRVTITTVSMMRFHKQGITCAGRPGGHLRDIANTSPAVTRALDV